MLDEKQIEPEEACVSTVIHSDIVTTVSQKLPTRSTINEVSEIFKLFADGSRLSIVWALNESEMCVCDLCALLKMKQSAVSHQLKKLKMSQVVKTRRDGKVIYYSLNDSHITTILDMGLEHISEQRTSRGAMR
jgi:ArsR family transcriptional regulator